MPEVETFCAKKDGVDHVVWAEQMGMRRGMKREGAEAKRWIGMNGSAAELAALTMAPELGRMHDGGYALPRTRLGLSPRHLYVSHV
jgi:hypothetical protein